MASCVAAESAEEFEDGTAAMSGTTAAASRASASLRRLSTATGTATGRRGGSGAVGDARGTVPSGGNRAERGAALLTAVPQAAAGPTELQAKPATGGPQAGTVRRALSGGP
eukprot:SRR837773.2487.p3 GENE.SRR837773.2487~~SRR837773.2487.p3  ORF type:complete len:111 (+),score=6.63 SRR837773.2487:239-571(+)